MIGICDADASHRAVIRQYIEKLFFSKTEISISEHDACEEMMNKAASGSTVYDLVVLDADRCGGMDFASFVKSTGISTDIIVYTSSDQYVFEGYQYRLFDYVLKNSTRHPFGDVLMRYIREKLDSGMDYLSIRSNGCIQNIRLDKICFFESRGRKLAAVTGDEKFEFYQKMDELVAVLPAGSFLRCHQSYTVNASLVYSLTSTEIVLKNGLRIPVSRRYYQELRAAFEQSKMA